MHRPEQVGIGYLTVPVPARKIKPLLVAQAQAVRPEFVIQLRAGLAQVCRRFAQRKAVLPAVCRGTHDTDDSVLHDRTGRDGGILFAQPALARCEQLQSLISRILTTADHSVIG